MDNGRFTVAPGVVDLIGAAVDGRNDAQYEVLLSGGDLNQMAVQKGYLVSQGFDVGQRDVYPALRAADANRAFRLLWENRIDGWWNLQREFISREICTDEEFRDALKKS